jgi:PAS domain S-box-containing protein
MSGADLASPATVLRRRFVSANLGQLGASPGNLSGMGEPRLHGHLLAPRSRTRRICKIYEDSEDARYPVLKVSTDGTLLHANRTGRELVSRLGYGIGQRLPDQLAGLFPEVLRSGVGEDIELRSEEEGFVFTVMPRPLLQPDGSGRPESMANGAPAHDPKALLDELPIFFYMTGLNGTGNNGWASPGIESLTGFCAEEYFSAPGFWESRLHPEDFWRVLKAFRTAGAAGGVSVEYRWRRANGTYGWFLDQAVLVNGNGGTERVLAGARMDITARKEAELWRQEGSDFLEALLGVVSDGVCLLDDNANYIFMNSPLESLLGYRREEWARGTMPVAVHPDDRQRFVSAVLAASGGKRAGCRARFRAQSGAFVELAMAISPFCWKGRELALASVNCTNRDR